MVRPPQPALRTFTASAKSGPVISTDRGLVRPSPFSFAGAASVCIAARRWSSTRAIVDVDFTRAETSISPRFDQGRILSGCWPGHHLLRPRYCFPGASAKRVHLGARPGRVSGVSGTPVVHCDRQMRLNGAARDILLRRSSSLS